MNEEDDLARQDVLFREVMDPYVRLLVAAKDPWDAYDAAATLRGVMHECLDWGPNGGAVFVAWAELEDVYETGKTPIADAHGALRQAAVEWLARPSEPSASFVESWVKRANQTVQAFFARDGDFWRPPS